MIGGIVNAAGTAATVVSSIIDQGKRRQFESALANLSNRQQEDLNNKLLTAKSDADKMQIISNSILQYAIANQNAESSKETKMYILAGGLAIVLLVTAVVLSRSKSKL